MKTIYIGNATTIMVNHRYYYLSYTIMATTTFTLVIAAITFVLSICRSRYCLSGVSFAVAVVAFCSFRLCGASATRAKNYFLGRKKFFPPEEIKIGTLLASVPSRTRTSLNMGRSAPSCRRRRISPWAASAASSHILHFPAQSNEGKLHSSETPYRYFFHEQEYR